MTSYYISQRHISSSEKVIRLVTHNTYNSHTEPTLKGNGLWNLVDMSLLNNYNFFTQTILQQFTIIFLNILGTPH